MAGMHTPHNIDSKRKSYLKKERMKNDGFTGDDTKRKTKGKAERCL